MAEFFFSRIKVWDGAAWTAKPVKVWDGAQWRTVIMKFRASDGTWK